MPKQNRPLVRDGRLQAPKKRTDRSYLSTSAASQPETLTAESDLEVETPELAEAQAEAAPAAAAAPVETPAMDRAARPTRLPPAARAIQQQGVRKKRELDPDELAERDTKYAIHELRRIAVLTLMVVATLIILGVVMR